MGAGSSNQKFPHDAELLRLVHERDEQIAALQEALRARSLPGSDSIAGRSASAFGASGAVPSGSMRAAADDPSVVDLLFVFADAGASAVEYLATNLADEDSIQPVVRMHHLSSLDAFSEISKTFLEEVASQAKMVVLILTDGILARGDVRFLLRCALHYDRVVELVHLAEDSPFPSDTAVPGYLHSLFNSKAITYLADYPGTALKQLRTRFANSVGERARSLARSAAALTQLHMHPMYLTKIGQFVCSACDQEFVETNGLMCTSIEQATYCVSCARATVALLPVERLDKPHDHVLTKVPAVNDIKCDNCRIDSKGLAFRCADCQHNLCVRCSYAALRCGTLSTVVLATHGHPVEFQAKIQHERLQDFGCEKCGKQHRGSRYGCGTCRNRYWCIWCVAELAAGVALPEFLSDEDPHAIHKAVFLSHKRSTGQSVAGRLFEGLKADFDCFLDSEARFKIHDLEQIVRRCDTFVFIMTAGILDSEWCLKEFRAAVQAQKPIVVVRHIDYKIPTQWPEERQDIGQAIAAAPKLVWMAEFNQECIDKLVRDFLGPRTVDQNAFFQDSWETLDFGSPPDSRLLMDLRYDPKMPLDLHAFIYCSAYYFPAAVRKIDTLELQAGDDFTKQEHVEMRHVEHRMPELPNLRTLRCNYKHVMPFVANYQLRYYSQIESLEVSIVGDISLLWTLCGKLPRLRALRIGMADLATLPPAPFPLTQLEALEIRAPGGGSPAEGDVTAALLKQCPNLTTLSLLHIRGANPSTLELAAKSCTCVSVLEVDPALLGKNWSNVLLQFTRLTRLKVDEWDFPAEAQKPTAASHLLTTLRSLELRRFKVSSDASSFESFSALAPSIRRADLVIPESFPDSGAVIIANSWSRVEVLRLLSVKLTDAGFASLNHCSNLQRLHLTGAHITDAGLRQFAAGAPRIRTLHVEGADELTDESATALSRFCPDLEHVDLSDTNVTDDGVRRLVDGCWRLSKLRLGGCKITDEAVRAAATLEFLEHLYVKRCQGVTDAGVEHLADAGCRRLGYLSLKRNAAFTEPPLLRLVERCPRLCRLRVDDYSMQLKVDERTWQRFLKDPVVRNSESWNAF